MTAARTAAEALLGAGVLILCPDEPITFASGIRSPVYMDIRRLIGDPSAWRTVIEGLGESLRGIGRGAGSGGGSGGGRNSAQFDRGLRGGASLLFRSQGSQAARPGASGGGGGCQGTEGGAGRGCGHHRGLQPGCGSGPSGGGWGGDGLSGGGGIWFCRDVLRFYGSRRGAFASGSFLGVVGGGVGAGRCLPTGGGGGAAVVVRPSPVEAGVLDGRFFRTTLGPDGRGRKPALCGIGPRSGAGLGGGAGRGARPPCSNGVDRSSPRPIPMCAHSSPTWPSTRRGALRGSPLWRGSWDIWPPSIPASR